MPALPPGAKCVVDSAKSSEDVVVNQNCSRVRLPCASRSDDTLRPGDGIGVPAGSDTGQDRSALGAAFAGGQSLHGVSEDVRPDSVPQRTGRTSSRAADRSRETAWAQALQSSAVFQGYALPSRRGEVRPVVAQGGADERSPRHVATERALTEQVREEQEPLGSRGDAGGLSRQPVVYVFDLARPRR